MAEQQAEQSTGTDAPRHVAIVMDGNGRWANRRGLARHAGHQAGVESVRQVVETAGRLGVEVLTLFAFSSENWQRPKKEVGLLMDLFLTALKREARKLDRNQVRLRVVGDRSAFDERLQSSIEQTEGLTRGNRGLNLVIAANYGGRWDIAEAARQLGRRIQAGEMGAEEISQDLLAEHLALHEYPDPDLFIRTGGEQRISNFLLWQLAYTEFYFTDTLWPDFHAQAFEQALEAYSSRQRRYGRTSQQVEEDGDRRSTSSILRRVRQPG